MKKIYFSIIAIAFLSLILPKNSFSQCANDNTLWIDITPPSCPGSEYTSCIFGGEYCTCNVTLGNTYVFQTCGDTDFDTEISLYNNANGAYIAFNEDYCGSQSAITWVATFTGTVRILVDQYLCTSVSTCMTLSATCSPPGVTYTHPIAGIQNSNLGTCMVNTCSGTYYDNGGAAGNYSLSINQVYRTFCPGLPGNCVRATVTSMDIENSAAGCYDWLSVLNGPTQNSTTLWQGCKTLAAQNTLAGTFTNPFTSTDGSGCLGFRFYSDASVTKPGWTISLSCVPCAGGPTVTEDNNCTSAAAVCGDSPVTGASTGPGLTSECSGCVVAENYSNWYTVYVGTTGTLAFILKPTSSIDDYDFAIYGPNPNCGALGAPVRCSYAASDLSGDGLPDNGNGWTGLSSATNLTFNNGVAGCGVANNGSDASEDVCGNGWVNDLLVTAGQTYMIMVNNWSPGGNGFIIDWTNLGILGVPPGSVTVQTNSTCSGASSGTACAVVNAGIPPYIYNWAGGLGSNACVNSQPVGNYTVTVTDGSGCISSATGTITALPTPVAPTASGTTICSGSSATLTATAPGGTYQWYDAASGGNLLTTNASYTTSALASTTTYYVQTTVAGCAGPRTAVTVNIYATATANAGGPRTICSNQTVAISGASYGGSATGCSWSSSGSGSFSGGNTTTPIYTPSAGDILAGSVTLTMSATGPCAAGTNSMILTITPLANAGFTYSSGTYCQSGLNPTPTINTAGGTFTYTPLGSLSINSSSGLINLAGSTPNTYSITYSVGGTCPNTYSANLTITSGFDAQFSYSGPYCQSVSNPTPTHSTGSNGTYSQTTGTGLVWVSTSTGEINIAASTPGIYSVTNTIAASGGCGVATFINSIEISQAATVNAGSDATICSGSNYTVSGASIGGSSTSVSWSTPGSGALSNGLTLTPTYQPSAGDIAAGTVTLTATTNDPTGPCPSVTDNIVITINPATQVLAGSDQTICATDIANLTGTQTGFSTPVTWSTPGNGGFSAASSLSSIYTPGSNDILAGSITLTLTSNDPDGSGPCIASSDDVLITINTTATLNAISDFAICSGENATVSATLGGSSTSLTWSSTGGGTFANPTSVSTLYTPSASEIAAGTTTLTATSNDPSGPCIEAIDNIVLTINPLPVITNITETQVTSCLAPNGTITITATGTWLEYSIDGGATFYTTANFTGLNSANYTVVVKNNTGCTATQNIQVTNSSGPAIDSLEVINPLCFGEAGQIIVHATGATLYSINGGPLVASNTFIGLTAGTYNLHVEDVGTCGTGDQATITEPTQIVLTPTATPVSCGVQGTATISATGGTPGYGYEWINTLTTSTITNLNPGSYPVTVTDLNGCTLTSFAVIALTPSVGNGQINNQINVSCYGGNNGSATVSMVNGTTPYTFAWSDLQTGATATNLIAGIYSVIISDSLGACIDTVPVTIIQPNQLLLDSSVVNAGCGVLGSVTVLPIGGTPTYTYAWDVAGSTPTISSLPIGTYHVTVTDSHGCTATSAIVVSPASGTGTGTVTQTNVNCFGETNGSATVNMTNGSAPFTYIWLHDVTNISNTANNLPAGNYFVTISDITGVCSVNLSFTIIQPTLLISSITSLDISCNNLNNGSLSASVSGGTPPFIYVWNTTPPQNGATINNLAPGTYSVIATDNHGCTTTSINSIAQPNALSIIPTVTNPTCFGGNNGSISVVISGGTPAYTYAWTGNYSTQNLTNVNAGIYTLTITDAHNCTLTSISSLLNPVAISITNVTSTSINNKGDIDVTVTGGLLPYTYNWSNGATTEDLNGLSNGIYIITVTDMNSCQESDTISIDILELPIEIPTVITPNNDGKNDDFEIKNIEQYLTVSIEIFNRWGDKIFTFSGTGIEYLNTSNRWNGKYKGKDLPMGGYVYIVKISNDKDPFTGVVSIVR